MNKHVLIVHNDTPFLSVLLEKLLSRGFNVRWASHGQEALRILEHCPIDLLAIDRNMLKGDLKVCKIPIFYLSENPLYHRVLDLPQDKSLITPATLDIFAEKVTSLLSLLPPS